MNNESKNEQTGKSECCSSGHKSCCCGGKLIAAALIAILLVGIGFCLGKNSNCGQQKICPLMQVPK